MNSGPFPIINLPAVPRRIIYGLFDSGDLFDISLCSKRMTQIIKETRTEAKCHTIYLKTDLTTIQVEFSKNRRILIWDFTSRIHETELTAKRKIGNVYFKNCQRERNPSVPLDIFNVSYPDASKGICEVSKHLSHIFPGPVEMEFSIAFSSELKIIFSYQHFQNFRCLKIEGKIMLKKLLEQVFGQITIQKKLVVDPDTDDEYPIIQALNVEDLELSNANWMSREHLVQLNCRFAYLKEHFFGWKDLEAFGEGWMRNLNSKIEMVRFGWSNGADILQMKGLEGHTWKYLEREKNYLINDSDGLIRVDCSRGLDIERNGVLATFVYHDESIYFFVWVNRFPGRFFFLKQKERLQQLSKKLKPQYEKLEELNRRYPDSCSLERLLSNPDLKLNEFVDTYRILRSMDAEVRLSSIGRSSRRTCFDTIYRMIDWQNDM